MNKPIYVLGTGLSHDGSSVLLKDGRICAGIEKERLSRIKHDGGNDTLTVQYCLDAEGITLDDLSLVVQCANFEIPDRERFQGKRLFAQRPDIPLLSISHHLAHAYSAIGTSPYEAFNVMVIDGCGSPYSQCLDRPAAALADPAISERTEMWCEKESLYHFDGETLHVLYKDFSEMSPAVPADDIGLPTTRHSIGGFYAAVSHYVFGSMSDAGKLMGLAPYGRAGAFDFEAFRFEAGRLFVRDEWKAHLRSPATSHDMFIRDFHYYADVARWAQEQVEAAILHCFSARSALSPADNWCYSGGVALNAAANSRLLQEGVVRNLYIEPAASDNGIALGCAYYGWLETLKQPRVRHDGDTCFGRAYGDTEIREAIDQGVPNGVRARYVRDEGALLESTARQLATGKVIGWFQGGSEFGPRALGRRSILADPGRAGMQQHINRNIKFREDFRPFAPSVCEEARGNYFRYDYDTPYMILLDEVRPEHNAALQSVVHVNGTARVQAVSPAWNRRYHALIRTFGAITGSDVLLNTSFNKKGTPIVETPREAIDLFVETAIDTLVLGEWILTKD